MDEAEGAALLFRVELLFVCWAIALDPAQRQRTRNIDIPIFFSVLFMAQKLVLND